MSRSDFPFSHATEFSARFAIPQLLRVADPRSVTRARALDGFQIPLDAQSSWTDHPHMLPLSLASRTRMVFFHIFVSLLLLDAFASRAQPFTETVLHNFTTNADDGGRVPSGGVIKGHDGYLYGTAENDDSGYGLVYRIDPNGSNYTVLHEFSNFFNGAYPLSVVQATNGFLYGPLSQGGTNSVGAIFIMSTNGTGYAQLHAFSPSEGLYPSSLFLASNGVFYGCEGEGGTANYGTIFRMNLDGSGLQILHNFTNAPDGRFPASITLAGDGALYGTAGGGSSNAGIVFKMETNGDNYAILHTFTNSPDGEEPLANLIQGRDGMLYGTTASGGASTGGILFKIATDGSGYTILHSFIGTVDDGYNAESIIQASDGFIYGTSLNGGHFGIGSFYKIDTNGANFSIVFSCGNLPDGQNPTAPLLEAGDGAFYGTANNGGIDGQGIILRLTPPLMLTSQVLTSGRTNTTILSWPLWATDYGVRTSPSLGSSATWTALTAPITNATKLYATNISTAPNVFFRLQSPP